MQITGALALAHGAGIVHRVLKPSNAMGDNNGIVTLIDFGVAKFSPNALKIQFPSKRHGLGTHATARQNPTR